MSEGTENDEIDGKECAMKWLALLLGLGMALWLVSCGEDDASESDGTISEGAQYEVYVLMSASWSGLSRFVEIEPDTIQQKAQEESPITFAYIKGPDVEMVFGPGPREETLFQIPKGSFGFVDQETLLARINVDADAVQTVVIEATCFDHAGGIDAFPNATFILQQKEFDAIPTTFSDGEDNERLKQLKEAGRLELIDGDQELAPGITAHFLGGHTQGTQFLSVQTADGLVVLGGDGLYTYENLEYDVISPFNVGMDAQRESYERIRTVLGDSDALLVPGHDMEVFRRFPTVADRVVQVRLD